MNQQLISTYHRLLSQFNYPRKRYLYDTMNLESRLTGIIGNRGTGKTTLLFQLIKEKIAAPDKCLYLSLDHLYFSEHSVLEFITEIYETTNIRYFFLDEVHKYGNWSQELKNCIDSFPDIQIIFSGSSSLDIIHGTYDLSRRARIFKLAGLSFREYLSFTLNQELPVYTLDTILSEPAKVCQEIAAIPALKGHFRSYLQQGYYPYLFEDQANYRYKLLNALNKSIYEDLSSYYRLKTENLIYFRRILHYLSTLPPAELSRFALAKHLGIDYKTTDHYLQLLNENGLIRLVASGKARADVLKAKEKVYLENPNLYSSLTLETGREPNIGTLRELFFTAMFGNAGLELEYSQTGDFASGDVIFEIGGKNKTAEQLKGMKNNAWLVKDDILYPVGREIPLWIFGFMY
jgi:uncharacterized protein